MTTKPSAGRKLRADLDAALERAERDEGRTLEFSEAEQLILASAAKTADRVEELRRLWQAELSADNPRPTIVVKLSAEIRLCEKAIHDLVARVNLGSGPVKSERHQRAVRYRWDKARNVATAGR